MQADLLIKTGKLPDESYNAALGFWLPPDTPFGNFQNKYMQVIRRLDGANRRIIESYSLWTAIMQGIAAGEPTSLYSRHMLANEEAVYMIRKSADELITMIWYLEETEQSGAFPTKLKVDCIGRIFGKDQKESKIPLYVPHSDFLRRLNDISNGYKHSFLDTYLVTGRKEPLIVATSTDRNDLDKETVDYLVPLGQVVQQFNEFYVECINWLRAFSERHRENPQGLTSLDRWLDATEGSEVETQT